MTQEQELYFFETIERRLREQEIQFSKRQIYQLNGPPKGLRISSYIERQVKFTNQPWIPNIYLNISFGTITTFPQEITTIDEILANSEKVEFIYLKAGQTIYGIRHFARIESLLQDSKIERIESITQNYQDSNGNFLSKKEQEALQRYFLENISPQMQLEAAVELLIPRFKDITESIFSF